MKKKLHNRDCKLLFAMAGIFTITVCSCRKMVEVPSPKTEVSASSILQSDDAATSAISGIYADMRSTFAGGDYYSVSALVSFSSDELTANNEFATNNLTPTDVSLGYLWASPYKEIYSANLLLEGLAKPNGLSADMSKEITGEAKFIRSFSYFYLVNLFGDVPLVLGTDWQKNANITRSPKQLVYQQIVADLKDAQSLLPNDYSAWGGERVRPTKFTATALLARVYLYLNDWSDSEKQASLVIDNTALYNLTPLDQIFLKNSDEAIWQMSYDTQNAADATIFPPNPDPLFSSPLRQSMVDKFSDDDQRKTTWMVALDDGNGNLAYYPSKYKAIDALQLTEYSMVMRLAEQYLIRAEARAQLGQITGNNSAITDLNKIRQRAGLPESTVVSQAEILSAIADERLREFFTEWGHRWFDLKRTGRATAVLGPIKPNWNSNKELFPIPKAQITNDPAMAQQQNPGY